ncbi:MAG: HAD family hydrolase [Anaerotardibacter sp.]
MATIFLDYDGTLHNSMFIYGPAFRKAYVWLVEQGYAQPRDFEDEEISQWLGWTVEDMWTTFMPSLPEPVWRKASHIIGDVMNEMVKEKQAALFPGTKETLQSLKDDGYELVFLSNCRNSYRDSHVKLFELEELFAATYTAEEFDDIPKWQIYQTVSKNHSLPHIMVGDRFHDIEVAIKAGIPSIGCAYGFNKPEELEEATVCIDSITDLPRAVSYVQALCNLA